MLYKNVLVPFDESESARNALQTAIEFVGDDPDARLTVLYACSSREVDEDSFNYAAARAGIQDVTAEGYARLQKEFMESQLAKLKKSVAAVARGCVCHVVCHVDPAKPAQAIVSYAHERDCDVIMMGSRGLNAVRGVLGSVSYAVLSTAKMPVLIVK
ncbi:MAG: universal stress protein [Coriobacteriales bacterium]